MRFLQPQIFVIEVHGFQRARAVTFGLLFQNTRPNVAAELNQPYEHLVEADDRNRTEN